VVLNYGWNVCLNFRSWQIEDFDCVNYCQFKYKLWCLFGRKWKFYDRLITPSQRDVPRGLSKWGLTSRGGSKSFLIKILNFDEILKLIGPIPDYVPTPNSNMLESLDRGVVRGGFSPQFEIEIGMGNFCGTVLKIKNELETNSKPLPSRDWNHLSEKFCIKV